jgi:hypothetical protein
MQTRNWQRSDKHARPNLKAPAAATVGKQKSPSDRLSRDLRMPDFFAPVILRLNTIQWMSYGEKPIYTESIGSSE